MQLLSNISQNYPYAVRLAEERGATRILIHPQIVNEATGVKIHPDVYGEMPFGLPLIIEIENSDGQKIVEGVLMREELSFVGKAQFIFLLGPKAVGCENKLKEYFGKDIELAYLSKLQELYGQLSLSSRAVLAMPRTDIEKRYVQVIRGDGSSFRHAIGQPPNSWPIRHAISQMQTPPRISRQPKLPSGASHLAYVFKEDGIEFHFEEGVLNHISFWSGDYSTYTSYTGVFVNGISLRNTKTEIEEVLGASATLESLPGDDRFNVPSLLFAKYPVHSLAIWYLDTLLTNPGCPVHHITIGDLSWWS